MSKMNKKNKKKKFKLIIKKINHLNIYKFNQIIKFGPKKKMIC